MRIIDKFKWCVRIAIGSLTLCSLGALAQDLTTLHDSGPSSKRVDIVILAEGYRSSERAEFLNHAQSLTDFLFDANRLDNKPFPEYQNFFNVHAFFIESAESGVSDPNTDLDTALNVTQDAGRRLSIDLSHTPANDYIRSLWFKADMIFVAANTNRFDQYSGGADGQYAIYNADYSGQDSHIGNVALHEMGHAFANLGDEYTNANGDYPPELFGIFNDDPPPPPFDATADEVSCGGVEYNNPHRPRFPEEYPNLARRADLVPWSHWDGIPAAFLGAVGTFEGGLNTYETGVFRPTENSKMRTPAMPFDPIATEEILLNMYADTGLLDNHTPTSNPLENFLILETQPIDADRFQYTWRVNGTVQNESSTSLSLCPLGLSAGKHSVELTVIDNTGNIRPRTRAFIAGAMVTPIGLPSTNTSPSKAEAAAASSFANAYRTLDAPRVCPSDYTRHTSILDREVSLAWSIELTHSLFSGTAQAPVRTQAIRFMAVMARTVS